MAKAKRPGVGQGVGGGRPKRNDAERIGSVSLSAEAAALLRAHCKQSGQPLWKALDAIVKDALRGAGGSAETPPMAGPRERPSWMLSP